MSVRHMSFPSYIYSYRPLAQAQAHFHVPNLFRVSLSLRGSAPQDAWFLAGIEFDFKIGGDDTGVVGLWHIGNWFDFLSNI